MTETKRKRNILQENQRQERRRRILIQVAVAAVLVALVAGIGVAFAIRKADKDSVGGQTPAIAAAQVPAKDSQVKLDIAHTADGGIKLGRAGAKVSIVLFEDFQCPWCKRFEDNSAAALAGLVESGVASIEYRPVAFLDRASTTGYSTRATNAAWAVAAADVTKWPAMHKALFDQQPPEGTAGLSDGQLAEIAKQAGAPDAVREAIDAGRFRGYIQQTTKKNLPADGTPTLTVNGRPQTLEQILDPQQLTAIVTAAANPPK